MWCGFAMAVLLREPRQGGVKIHENEALAFETAFRRSVYRHDRWWNPAFLARELRYRAKHLLRRWSPGLYESLRRQLRHGNL